MITMFQHFYINFRQTFFRAKLLLSFILGSFFIMQESLHAQTAPKMEYWIIYLQPFTTKEITEDPYWQVKKELEWATKYQCQIQFLHQLEDQIWQIWVETTSLDAAQIQIVQEALSKDPWIKRVDIDISYQQKYHQDKKAPNLFEGLIKIPETQDDLAAPKALSDDVPKLDQDANFIWSDQILDD
jgi:hypothetical protein